MEEQKIDLIFELVDSLMRHALFSDLNHALYNPPSDPDTCLTVLTATLPAKSKLPNRQKWADLAVKTLQPQEYQGLL